MGEALIQLLAGTVGAALLYMFFRVAETRWPNSYYSQGDARSFRISKRPLGYVAFRFTPVLVVTFFMVATLIGADQPYAMAAFVLTAFHLSIHIGHAVLNIATAVKSSMWDRTSLLLGYALVVGGVVLAVPLGIAAGSNEQLRMLVPPPSQLTGSLWTGAFAAVVGVYFLRATEGGDVSIGEMIQYVRFDGWG